MMRFVLLLVLICGCYESHFPQDAGVQDSSVGDVPHE